MHRVPVTTTTVNRKPSHKRDKTQGFRQPGSKEDYGRLRAEDETRLQSAATDGGAAAAADYSSQSGGTKHGTYTSYEPIYIYKDGRVPTPPEAPAPLQPGDAAKMFGSFEDSPMPYGSLATLDKTNVLPLGAMATQPVQIGQCQTYDNDLMSEPPPPTAAVITAAAHTALATAAAPAFVGASDSNHSAPQCNVAHTPVPAATHASTLRHQSSTASNPDTTRVYEKSENTGTIRRKRSVKKDVETKTVAIQETDKPYDKPLKGVLKQTSAYDRLVPLMAKAPGASPIQTAPSFSPTTTSPKIGGGESRMGEYPYETLQRSPSLKGGTPAATHGSRRKNKHNNQTTTTLTQTNAPK
ncbi:uncharacterized protein [Panulirus ornatus]|uniref:uncharacterized protein n=1 Tax=Panulirus ornatus TaxID=150431 RepID=UPI003A8586B7